MAVTGQFTKRWKVRPSNRSPGAGDLLEAHAHRGDWRIEAAAERGISRRAFLELLDERAELLDHRCTYCGIKTRKVVVFSNHGGIQLDARTWDHRIPRSAGGSHDDDNLALACWGCNKAKGVSFGE